MTTIDALDDVYPDARFVMTHRDIGSVLPSLCSLKEALSKPVVETLDLHALGRHEVRLWGESLRRLVEFRDSGRECRFFDVYFNDMQSDPIAAMEKLYAHLGDDLAAGARERMVEWWGEKREGPAPRVTTRSGGVRPRCAVTSGGLCLLSRQVRHSPGRRWSPLIPDIPSGSRRVDMAVLSSGGGGDQWSTVRS